MTNDWQLTAYALRKAPCLVVGLLVIGMSSAFSIDMLLRLERAGDKSYRAGPTSMWFNLPRTYLGHVQSDGWSRWPLVMTWVCLVVGIASLVVGLFQLGSF
jgi:hypothetical protein